MYVWTFIIVKDYSVCCETVVYTCVVMTVVFIMFFHIGKIGLLFLRGRCDILTICLHLWPCWSSLGPLLMISSKLFKTSAQNSFCSCDSSRSTNFDATCSVSYTHLDVYKRQLMYSFQVFSVFQLSFQCIIKLAEYKW